MKTIIAGSRGVSDYQRIVKAVEDSGFQITEVVSGTARGVDRLGERYAEEHGIPVKHFPANWGVHGRAAGPIRNVAMAEYAEALIAVWNGISAGTAHMIATAKTKGLHVHVVKPRRKPKQ